MDRQTDRGTNTLASRGLEEPFFQLFCCVVLVFGSCGNKVFDLLFVCWVRGSGDYDRKKKRYSRLSDRLCCCIVFCRLWPEKKVPVVCLAGCAVASVFGSGDYDRKKKSSSRLSGGLCYDRKNKVPVVARAITTEKKKVQVVIKFVLVQLELKLIQIC